MCVDVGEKRWVSKKETHTRTEMRWPKQRWEESDNNDAFHWVHCVSGSKFTDTIGVYPLLRGGGAIQSTFNFWMVLRSCTRVVWSGREAWLVVVPRCVSRDILDVLYLSIRPGFFAAAIFALYLLCRHPLFSYASAFVVQISWNSIIDFYNRLFIE